ncbi:ketopantoate reductase family protein [Azospirillum isscasi]|uniref:2-dehydropantoate 2-reductase n=1 Tax=Azospirillum isscasi TaxID=3053926 RepID=A0ABU0WC06_9PROT|nr:2-dehydropantoate 2-reductase N-terminal domain-containing protein [Azospirillum isscasi]MDQ2101700.1 2-dehydropantoate 2-reductase N-terminal domain-containing protein [Azospirillum isscasi]
MKVAVIGAGAVGGLIAARLTAAGLPAALVARRRTLDTLRREGLTVEGPSGRPVTVRPLVTDDTLSLGPQDVVVLAVPAPLLTGVLDLLLPLLGPQTRLVPVVGGIPWWYPAGEAIGGPLSAIDPKGLLTDAIPADRIVGAVARVAVERRSPGYLRHLGGLRLALGPVADGQDAGDLAALFGAGGFNALAVADIRAEVWTALLAPFVFGLLGLATGKPAQEIAHDADLQPAFAAVVEELLALAAALGHPAAAKLEDVWTMAQHPGRIRPALRADVAAGRRAEIEAVLDAPLELAERAGLSLPTVNALRTTLRDGTQH